MGSIDPVPQTGKIQRPHRPDPDAPKPIPLPARNLTFTGGLGVFLGFALFGLGAFQGWNVVTMGIGAAFMAAGASTRAPRPQKLCPACRLEIPLEATLCGHCRTEQPA